MADSKVLTRMEFSVQMTCSSCADIIRSKLNCAGIHNVEVVIPQDLVIVDTVLKTGEVQALLESTGLLVFFKGFGSTLNLAADQAATVAILKGKNEGIGLIRMVQTTSTQCVIEITLDRLPCGDYAVNIHQLGDLSHGGESCGDVLTSGCLGHVKVDKGGSGSLQTVSEHIKICDVIGRSVVVSSKGDRRLYGVIARSAGVLQNPKRLCTCDGVSIWDEAKQNQHKTEQSSSNDHPV